MIVAMFMKYGWIIGVMVFQTLLVGCAGERPEPGDTSNSTPTIAAKSPTPNDDPKGEFLRSENGTPQATPKPGKANIQGKVFYNLKPAPNIEVKLCVTPNTFADCIGEKHVVKTDENGQYVFADLDPKVYGGLFVRVFETKSYVFTGKYGFLSQKIKAETDKTFFVPLTSLFRSDLKVLNPQPKAKMDAENLEIRWETFPDAAYYTIELMEFSGTVYHLNGERTAATSYKVEDPPRNGAYRLRIEAYNFAGVKIGQAGSGIEFSVINGLPRDQPAR